MADVLIIDDEKGICDVLEEIVQRLGYEAICFQTLEQGLNAVHGQPFKAVYLDINMPDGNGLEALPKIRKSPFHPEVIIITGFGDLKAAETAVKNGAWDFLQKPISTHKFLLSVKRVLQFRSYDHFGSNPSFQLKILGIVGESSAMNRCYEMIRLSADSDANVLIYGETGTGKELFARAIHDNSRRSTQPFVVLDCGAIAGSLVESELFGHRRGSFTGADKNKSGLIERANHGTLFLDEVGELPLEIQKAFLRVLQERRFRPVGGSKEIVSDFRVIAATNRNLDAMNAEGRFRSELIYRLKGISMVLPPLRDRMEDLDKLSIYYMDKICLKYGVPAKEISPEAFEILKFYDWPGNIREFINTLDSAISASKKASVLFPVHIPEYIRVRFLKDTLHVPGGISAAVSPASFCGQEDSFLSYKDFRNQTLDDAEKKYFQKLFAYTKGNIRHMGKITGLGRTRLYNLLKKHGIPKTASEH